MTSNINFNPGLFQERLHTYLEEIQLYGSLTEKNPICDKMLKLFQDYRAFATQKDWGRQEMFNAVLDRTVATLHCTCPALAKVIKQQVLHIGRKEEKSTSSNFAGLVCAHQDYDVIPDPVNVSMAKIPKIPEKQTSVKPTLNFEGASVELSLEEQLGVFLKRLREIIKVLQRQGTLSLSEQEIKDCLKQISTEALSQKLIESSEDPPFDLITQLTDLDRCETLEDLKAIERSILKHSLIKEKIVEDLRSALRPLMFYLARLNFKNYLEALTDLEHLRKILRRWGFVEENNHIGGQEDMLECLQKLYDFLEEDSTQAPRIKCEVMLSSNTKDWIYQDFGDEDYDMLGEKFYKYEQQGLAIPHDRLTLREQGKEYAKTLIYRQSLGEVLATTHEVSASHQEEKLFSPFFPIFPQEQSLLPKQDLEQAFSQSFGDESHRIFYEINVAEQKIQKVQVPVIERRITFTGNPPPGLILSRQVGLYEQGAFEMAPIAIPNIIHLEKKNYKLKMAAAKSGFAQAGHYVAFLDYSSKQAWYTNSLESDPLRLTEQPLDQTVSQHPNICVCSYQLEDPLVNFPPIQRKLYQSGQDNLCYLILAVQAIYGNPLFKSINAFTELAQSSNTNSPSINTGPIFRLSENPVAVQNSSIVKPHPEEMQFDVIPDIFVQPLDTESEQRLEEVGIIVVALMEIQDEKDLDPKIKWDDTLQLLSQLLVDNASQSPFSKLLELYSRSFSSALFKGILDSYLHLKRSIRETYQELDTALTTLQDPKGSVILSKKRDYTTAMLGLNEEFINERKKLEALHSSLVIQIQQSFERTIEILEPQLQASTYPKELLNHYGLAWFGLIKLCPTLYPFEAAENAFQAIRENFQNWLDINLLDDEQ